MSKVEDAARIEFVLRVKGEWWDEFWEERNGVLVKVHETEKRLNTQMNSFAQVMVAAFCQNDATILGGFQYHAQGNGDAGWGATPPAVNTADTTLFAETLRKVPDSIDFLDLSDVPQVGRSPRVRVRTTYALAEMAGETIREQAVFGGDATAAAGSGLICNVIRHSGIFKSGAVQLIRNVKFTFQ